MFPILFLIFSLFLTEDLEIRSLEREIERTERIFHMRIEKTNHISHGQREIDIIGSFKETMNIYMCIYTHLYTRIDTQRCVYQCVCVCVCVIEVGKN